MGKLIGSTVQVEMSEGALARRDGVRPDPIEDICGQNRQGEPSSCDVLNSRANGRAGLQVLQTAETHWCVASHSGSPSLALSVDSTSRRARRAIWLVDSSGGKKGPAMLLFSTAARPC